MSPILPPGLREAISRYIERVPAKTLARAADALSEFYRAGASSSAAVAAEEDAAAYLAARMPATYAAMASALSRVAEHAPSFAPASLIDAGAGPGTASHAALAQWPDIGRVTMLDRNPSLLAAARALSEGAASPAIRNATILAGDLLAAAANEPSDLVLLGYAIAEMPSASLHAVLDSLWRAATGVLVIVEPGTPSGFARILACRTHLLRRGARILAPCPNESPCPGDWCHFSVRLPRSRAHMRAKAARVPFEDEKFSYLAVARDCVGANLPKARIVAEPRIAKPAITLTLCGEGVIEARSIPAHEKSAHKRAAKAKWGDSFSP